jgi:acyl-CoA reductase-like NAD-dependent aldehyde dehydrogenase
MVDPSLVLRWAHLGRGRNPRYRPIIEEARRDLEAHIAEIQAEQEAKNVALHQIDHSHIRPLQFGPVLPIFGYDSVDDAVTAANATEFGLTASLWTSDDALADRITGRLVAGTVSVNCHGLAAQDPRLPFGGCGQSGIGRELGVEGIRAFTQPRAFVRHPVPG